jgi:HlyD family secretion protein
MRRWVIRGLVVAAVVGVLTLLRLTLFAPDPIAVAVAPVERGAVEETVSNSRAGTVKAGRRALLSPEMGGQVVALPFREGQAVSAGDLVLQLEDSAQQARLALARRELEAAAAERERACLVAERAARELERTRRLAAEQIVGADALDAVETARREAEAACRVARAGVDRAAAAVAVVETELAKMALRAPFGGVVAEVGIEIGEWTTPSPPALPVPAVIDLLDPSSLYVSAPIDEVDSARVVVGQSARLTVDSFRDHVLAGRVRRIAPYVLDVQEQNRTVDVELDFAENPLPQGLLPGTSADVEIVLAVHEGALRLPTPALMEGGRVLVLAEGVLAERTVEIGLRNWDFTEVLSGLAEGDLVVTSLDREEVKPGARARPAGAS